jgi:glycosyltransferase involved in cell wall biosynthesis
MNTVAQPWRFENQQRRALRVTMLGIRGFPDVQGGAEKHVENLTCALAELGCDAEAIVRSSYVAKGQPARWRNIKLTRVWAPRITGVEAFVHTFLGVLRAARDRPDILHIHAIGPAFFTPLARALGLRVVITCHSRNYEHKKWGRVGRSILRLGERAGMAFANGRVAVSGGLAEHLTRNHRKPVVTIPNGIDRPTRIDSTATLDAFDLTPNRYFLMVARLDEDKRQHDLIEAFSRLKEPAWKLALVGGADYSSAYAREVAKSAERTPGVVLLGHQGGTALAELYTHAAAFVLPSRFEGQPIAVLEAASHGLPVILSDIAAHRELAIPRARYFGVGDVAALANHLAGVGASPASGRLDAAECARLLAEHDWHGIAQRTLAVYCDALSESANGAFTADPRAARIREPS